AHRDAQCLDGLGDARLARNLNRQAFHCQYGVVGEAGMNDLGHCATLTETGRARSLRMRGSKASCTASAKILADSTSASKNTKAPSRFHQIIGSRDISRRAESIMVPNDGVLGSTPIPRYDSTASYSTSPENSSTSVISTICITLGSKCLRMIRQCPTPKARAACTYSSSLSLSVSARQSPHRPAQTVSP